MEERGNGKTEGPVFRHIRRYICEYCGISRSKKALLASHILSSHQDEIKDKKYADVETGVKLNICEDCGVSFRKPAYLKQHMQSHSLEYQAGGPPEKLHQRPFACPLDDCHSVYRRKDHLTRHLLTHERKLFECPKCSRRFAFQGNMTRHVKEFHSKESSSVGVESQKRHVCPEPGCGKVFQYASRLRKHEDSHVRLNAVEVICSEPGCKKSFTNEKCLKAHLNSCHRHISCDICGTKQLKKNIKRHLCTHEKLHKKTVDSGRVRCSFTGCDHTFSNASNLRQHIKAFHSKLKPFACGFSGCGKRFPYKHVRDRHEISGCHAFVPGDFVETDEQFRMNPRGGQKRICPPVEAFTQKRVRLPSDSDSLSSRGADYISWLLSIGTND